LEHISKHETSLRDYANAKLSELDFLNIQGNSTNKGAIFSFTLKGAGHPHDISTIIDQRGIAVRAGHHCAQPLMKHLGVTSTARASFAMYNTTEEIDKLADALSFCYEILS
jgi:cysteine desulfurase/selenocysteine lyase